MRCSEAALKLNSTALIINPGTLECLQGIRIVRGSKKIYQSKLEVRLLYQASAFQSLKRTYHVGEDQTSSLGTCVSDVLIFPLPIDMARDQRKRKNLPQETQ